MTKFYYDESTRKKAVFEKQSGLYSDYEKKVLPDKVKDQPSMFLGIRRGTQLHYIEAMSIEYSRLLTRKLQESTKNGAEPPQILDITDETHEFSSAFYQSALKLFAGCGMDITPSNAMSLLSFLLVLESDLSFSEEHDSGHTLLLEELIKYIDEDRIDMNDLLLFYQRYSDEAKWRKVEDLLTLKPHTMGTLIERMKARIFSGQGVEIVCNTPKLIPMITLDALLNILEHIASSKSKSNLPLNAILNFSKGFCEYHGVQKKTHERDALLASLSRVVKEADLSRSEYYDALFEDPYYVKDKEFDRLRWQIVLNPRLTNPATILNAPATSFQATYELQIAQLAASVDQIRFELEAERVKNRKLEELVKCISSREELSAAAKIEMTPSPSKMVSRIGVESSRFGSSIEPSEARKVEMMQTPQQWQKQEMRNESTDLGKLATAATYPEEQKASFSLDKSVIASPCRDQICTLKVLKTEIPDTISKDSTYSIDPKGLRFPKRGINYGLNLTTISCGKSGDIDCQSYAAGQGELLQIAWQAGRYVAIDKKIDYCCRLQFPVSKGPVILEKGRIYVISCTMFEVLDVSQTALQINFCKFGVAGDKNGSKSKFRAQDDMEDPSFVLKEKADIGRRADNWIRIPQCELDIELTLDNSEGIWFAMPNDKAEFGRLLKTSNEIESRQPSSPIELENGMKIFTGPLEFEIMITP